METTKPKYDGPKSACTCGHTGDGPGSQHRSQIPTLGDGHGMCGVEGCPCLQFTWAGWLREFTEHRLAERLANRS